MERVSDKAVVFLPWNTIEPEAQQQIMNTATMPFVFKHVAVIPDCHYGKGATVGTVLPTDGAVIPAAVGVDIGCGMIAVRTPLKRPDVTSPGKLRASIERVIPMSAGKNNQKLTATAAARVKALEDLARETRATPDQYDKNWRLALGTLGGGNHFIELAEDTDGAVWVTLHSGSRFQNQQLERALQELNIRGGILIDAAYGFKSFRASAGMGQWMPLRRPNYARNTLITLTLTPHSSSICWC